jgi:Zn-dependent protease
MLDLLALIILFFSITFHEVAHGYVALLYGDQTAKLQGRLSLSPLRHVDKFGTILLPLLLYFSGLPLIGWAKPVPINPNNFHDPRKGMLLCALAGPLTNFSLALIFVILRKLIPLHGFFEYILINGIFINLVLGTFNLIPIPPLDGSRIVSYFLKGEWFYKYNRLEPYGILIILILSYFGFLNFLLKLLNPFFKVFLQ